MTTYPFTQENVSSTLGKLNFQEFAKELFSRANIDEPVSAFLDSNCKISFAETMAEVDGALLATAWHVDPEWSNRTDWFSLSSWLPKTIPSRIDEFENALEAEAKELFVGLGGKLENW